MAWPVADLKARLWGEVKRDELSVLYLFARGNLPRSAFCESLCGFLGSTSEADPALEAIWDDAVGDDGDTSTLSYVQLREMLERFAVARKGLGVEELIEQGTPSPSPPHMATNSPSPCSRSPTERPSDIFGGRACRGQAIDQQAFRVAMTKLGMRAHPREIDALFESIDVDGTGLVDRKALLSLLRDRQHGRLAGASVAELEATTPARAASPRRAPPDLATRSVSPRRTPAETALAEDAAVVARAAAAARVAAARSAHGTLSVSKKPLPSSEELEAATALAERAAALAASRAAMWSTPHPASSGIWVSVGGGGGGRAQSPRPAPSPRAAVSPRAQSPRAMSPRAASPRRAAIKGRDGPPAVPAWERRAEASKDQKAAVTDEVAKGGQPAVEEATEALVPILHSGPAADDPSSEAVHSAFDALSLSHSADEVAMIAQAVCPGSDAVPRVRSPARASVPCQRSSTTTPPRRTTPISSRALSPRPSAALSSDGGITASRVAASVASSSSSQSQRPRSTPRSRRLHTESQDLLRSKLHASTTTPGPGHYASQSALPAPGRGAIEAPSPWAASASSRLPPAPPSAGAGRAPGEYEPHEPSKPSLAVSAAAVRSPSVRSQQGRGWHSDATAGRKGVEMRRELDTPGPGSYHSDRPASSIAAAVSGEGGRGLSSAFRSGSPQHAPHPKMTTTPAPGAYSVGGEAAGGVTREGQLGGVGFKSGTERFGAERKATGEAVGPQSYAPDVYGATEKPREGASASFSNDAARKTSAWLQGIFGSGSEGPGPGSYSHADKEGRGAIEAPSPWAASASSRLPPAPPSAGAGRAPGEYEPHEPSKPSLAVSAAAVRSPSVRSQQGRGWHSDATAGRKGVEMRRELDTPGPGSYHSDRPASSIAAAVSGEGGRGLSSAFRSGSPQHAPHPKMTTTPAPGAYSVGGEAAGGVTREGQLGGVGFKSGTERFGAERKATGEAVGPQSYAPDQGEQWASERRAAGGQLGAESYPFSSTAHRTAPSAHASASPTVAAT